MKLNNNERVVWAIAFVLELAERDKDRFRYPDGLDPKLVQQLFQAHTGRAAIAAAWSANDVLRRLRGLIPLFPTNAEMPNNVEMQETLASVLGIETGAPYR